MNIELIEVATNDEQSETVPRKSKVTKRIEDLENETGLFATEFLRESSEHLVKEITAILSDFSVKMFLHKFDRLSEDVQLLIIDGVYNKHDDLGIIERKAEMKQDDAQILMIDDSQNQHKEPRTIELEKKHTDGIEAERKIVYSLVKIFACKTMIKALKEMNIFDKIDEYEANHRAMDKNCIQLLNGVTDSNFFKKNVYEIVFKNCSSSENVSPVKVLEMAIESKALHFLSSNPCQAEVRKRWEPVLRLRSYYLFFDIAWVVLTLAIPYLRLLHRSNRSAFFKMYECKADSLYNISRSALMIIWYVPITVWTSPSGKFILHWLFRFFYCVLLTYQLLKGDPYALSHYINGPISVMFIQILYLMDTISKIACVLYFIPSDSLLCRFKVAIRYSCDVETVFFILALAYVVIIYFTKGLNESLAFLILERVFTLLFFASFIYSTLYLLFILSLDHFYSSIILTIKKMAVFTVRFFILFLFFWIAYGVCVVHIQDSYVKNATRTHVIWRVFKSGSFEIFGEADDKYADFLECGEFPFDSNNITSPALRCFVDSWFLPLSLFLYMFVSAVVLVNLLTAFLTQIHEDHKETRIFYKHYMKCTYMIRYEKCYLFPPVAYIPGFLHILYCVCRNIKRNFSSCNEENRRLKQKKNKDTETETEPLHSLNSKFDDSS